MTSNRPKSERIYVTAKTRMVSEERARKQVKFLNFLTAWYSFFLIAISIGNFSHIITSNIVSFSATLLSVALFGLSLFLLGSRIIQNADEHRLCYLNLKRIYHSNSSESEKINQYDEELARYPNHDPIDYDIMICDAEDRGQNLWNENGDIRSTAEMRKSVQRHRFLTTAVSVALLFLPLVLIGASAILAGNSSDVTNSTDVSTRDR